LERLSTGKRINSAADDAGGLSVAYKAKFKDEPHQCHHPEFAKCTIILAERKILVFQRRVKSWTAWLNYAPWLRILPRILEILKITPRSSWSFRVS
jgi:hypothetical protein